MATKRDGKDAFDAQKFVQCLGSLIDTLPSEAHRQQIVSQLETVIQFLNDLKHRFASFPTQHDAVSARASLSELTTLFSQAKNSPVLGAVVGLVTVPQRPRPRPITPEEVERAKSTIARFEQLPIDQLRAGLDELKVGDLRAVASVLGIRSTRRPSQEALTQHIATRITNSRGYRSLRDGGE